MQYPDLHQFPYFALDTETTGLHYLSDRIFGFSISTPDGKDYYYDIRHTPKALAWLKERAKTYKGIIIFANTSFDVRMLDFSNVNLLHCDLDDVIIRASCINEHLHSYSLDALGKKYLGRQKVDTIYAELAGLFGGLATRNVQIGRLADAPIEMVAPYAKGDSRLTLDLWEWQGKEIMRQEIGDICTFEKDLIKTFIRMEMHGIRINAAYAEQAHDKLSPIIHNMQTDINQLFNDDVNVNSSPQIKKIFEPEQKVDGNWYANDGTLLEKTPKGNASLGADALRIMKHPGAAMILEQRSLLKTRDTFLAKHVLEHNINGRVYPNINQSKNESGGTGTGRLSIQDPAMQQIPNRNKEIAAIVKPCFLPDEGEVWVDADLASFEVRVFAHLANDPKVIAAFEDNPELDFHQFVADISGLDREAKYSGQPNAKQLNLSMIFNSGNGAIADKMGMDWEWDSFNQGSNKITYKKAGAEAMKVIDHYHEQLPGVKKLANRCKKQALKRGYVETQFGRKLRFPHGFKAYKASGLQIQATSADINKENIDIITRTLDGRGHLLLNTHDSYSMSMPEYDWHHQFVDIKHNIERPIISVPLILELSGTGKNWWAALEKK